MTTLISNNRASFVVSMQNKDFVVNPPSTSPDFPLKFTAHEPNSTISFVKNKTIPFDVSLETSTDGFNWTSYTVDDVKTLSNVNDSIYFRAGPAGNIRFAGFTTGRNGTVTNNAFYHFEMFGSIEATGNILSLLNRDQSKAKMEEIPGVVAGQTSGSFTFFGLFYNCTALTTAPLLPSKNLTSHCYDCMFRGCTSLREMPALPAKDIPVGSYMHMFNGCSFKRVKRIGAVRLENASCYSMFQNCSQLEYADNLFNMIEYADTFSMRYMFWNCFNLKVGPSMYTTGRAGHATFNSAFLNCYALTAVPKIHIESLRNRSGLYGQMFSGCSSITSVPIDYLRNSASVISSHLSAYNSFDPDEADTGVTVTSSNIREMYATMFKDCTNLTVAPFLYECALSTAKYQASSEYQSIFEGCSALSSLSTDFTHYSANNNMINMIKNTASNGVLWCKEVGDLSDHLADLGNTSWTVSAYTDDNWKDIVY